MWYIICGVMVHLIQNSVAINSDTSNLQNNNAIWNSFNRENESLDVESKVLSREKRQLIFPVQTLLQLSLCYVSPADVKRNIYVNQGFQLNWVLPNETDQLPSTFFVVPPVINARSRDKRSEKAVEAEDTMQQEAIKFFDSITTEHIYFMIETLLNYNGYNGTQCLLHAICHMATIPLEQDGDLFHEVVQFILTPSDHIKEKPPNVPLVEENDFLLTGQYSAIKNPVPFLKYHEAEMLGRSMRSEYNTYICDDTYTCPNSPLDQFTHVLFEEEML